MTDGSRIFRTASGQPWRYAGVSAFPLVRQFADGGPAAIQPFLDAFAPLGFTVLRAFDYVTWLGTGWDSPGPAATLNCLAFLASQGWYLELVIYTGDEPDRVDAGIALAQALAVASPPNLLIEGANENGINGKGISPDALLRINSLCAQAQIPYCGWLASGHLLGTYLTAHTPRDADWPRKAHDLLEYYDGGGPGSPSDPAHHLPCVADEPIRPDQAGFAAQDFLAYAGVCSLLGAGATFHFEGGKHGRLPTPDEQRCAEAFARGLSVFPPDAPLGAYARIDEQGRTSRTYVMGGRYMVRVRPTTPEAPEPGWIPFDDFGICWRR